MFYLKQFCAGDYGGWLLKSGIYKITFIGCEHSYVGSAVCFSERWSLHRHQLRRRIHANIMLQRAYDKYGENAIRFTVLEIVPEKLHLVSREQFWMDEIRPDFNILKRAGSQLGLKHSEETRAKISEFNRRRKRSPESIAKWKATMILVGGFKKSPAWIAKMTGMKRDPSVGIKISAAKMGHIVSAETRAKISATKKAQFSKTS